MGLLNTLQPEDRDAALAIRSPAAVYADMEIHVAARVRSCGDEYSRNSISTDPSSSRNVTNSGRGSGKNRRKNKGNNRNKNKDEKYKYFWSIEGPNSADLSSRNQPELRLDRGTLHGGQNYTVSCRVVRESGRQFNRIQIIWVIF